MTVFGMPRSPSLFSGGDWVKPLETRARNQGDQLGTACTARLFKNTGKVRPGSVVGDPEHASRLRQGSPLLQGNRNLGLTAREAVNILKFSGTNRHRVGIAYEDEDHRHIVRHAPGTPGQSGNLDDIVALTARPGYRQHPAGISTAAVCARKRIGNCDLKRPVGRTACRV